MRRHFLIPALMLGLGLGALVALTSPAAEKVDSNRINKLIEQMGNGDFQEREKATKELQAIGLPALEGLKKAAQSSDAEVASRARNLLKKMETQVVSGQVLKPTRVHFVFKDTPLTKALAEIREKTGYNINLIDPENKLKDKTITLDTGDVTFWQAFDQFCAKAGLIEPTWDEINKARLAVPPPPPGVPVPLPAPVPPRGIKKALPPTPAPAPDTAPAKKEAAAPVRGKATAVAVAVAPRKPAPPAAAPGAPAVAPAAPPVAPPPPPAIGAPAIIIRPGGPMRPFPAMGPGQITLMPGKPRTVPTDAHSSIRVRVSPHDSPFAKAAEGEKLVTLEVFPEPKIQWQQLVDVRIEKAVDDKDQKLKTAEARPGDGLPGGGGPGFGGGGIAPAPPGVARPAIAIVRPIGFGGMGMMGMGGRGMGGQVLVPVRLTQGAKAAKALKELKGTLKARVLTTPEEGIVVNKVLEAKGKTIKGESGGWIKILDVEKDENGQVRIRYEMQAPPDMIPDYGAVNVGVPMPPGGPVGVPIRVPPARRGPALPKGALQAGGKVEIQIGVGGAGGGVAVPGRVGIAVPGGMPQFTGTIQGVTLRDAKGKVLPVSPMFAGRFDGGQFRQEITLTYNPGKDGAKPARLVFSGRKMALIEIPFSLTDIKLP